MKVSYGLMNRAANEFSNAMMPLSTAMIRTGAAGLLADHLVASVGALEM